MFSQITFMVLVKKCGWKDRLFDKIASHQLFYRYFLIRCITTNKFCCCQSYPHLLLVCIRLIISMNDRKYLRDSLFRVPMSRWLVTHNYYLNVNEANTAPWAAFILLIDCHVLFYLNYLLFCYLNGLAYWLILKWKMTDDVDWFNFDLQTREY